MQRNKNNYWNLYAKKEHNHDDTYIPRSELTAWDKHYGVPKIGGDGVMEVGQYIDMHSFESGKPKNNYDVRIICINPNNQPNGSGNLHVEARYATLGNYPSQFKMGYELNAQDSGLVTDKRNAVLGASYAIFLKANNFFDGANDIHNDRNKGASQLVLETNQYPKFRWSSYPEQGYGIAQWSPLYEILTEHEGQQVVRGKEWLQNPDFNYVVNSGIYPCEITHSANKPIAYNWGLLLVFTSRDSSFIVQMYVPHSTNPPCTRAR